MMIAQVQLKKGSKAPQHLHENEQVTYATLCISNHCRSHSAAFVN